VVAPSMSMWYSTTRMVRLVPPPDKVVR
jgi:hypothetical protein